MAKEVFVSIVGEPKGYSKMTLTEVKSLCLIRNLWVCNNAVIANIEDYLRKAVRSKLPIYINLISPV
jgi:hypothetical protein